MELWMNHGLADIRSISPKRHIMYSPNFHKWARQHPHSCGFYTLREDFGPWNSGSLFVGRVYNDSPASCSASLFMHVLCFGTKDEHGEPLGLASRLKPRPDLELRYIAGGRCALFPEHDKGFIGQWQDESDFERTCKFCGRRERYVKVGEHIEEDFEWIATFPGTDLACN